MAVVAAGTSCATVLVVMLVIGAIAVLGNANGWSPSPPVGTPDLTVSPPPPDTSADPPPGSVRVVRVDRAGTGLTVRVNADVATCSDYPNARVTLTETATTVILTTAPGTPVKECSGGPYGAIVHATLSRPLGTRSLRDDHGAAVRAIRDADMPIVPAPWQEVVPTGAVWTGHEYSYDFTRGGGPDILVEIMDHGSITDGQSYSVGSGSVTGASAIRLGSRTGRIVPDGVTLDVVWEVGDLTYTLQILGTEGSAPADEQSVRAIVAQLTWP
jgi:hypothetical protein